jgi:hypothetical protein
VLEYNLGVREEHFKAKEVVVVHRELEEDAVRVGAVHAVPDLRRPALRERADDGVHFAVKLNPPHLAPEVLVGIFQ